jgi:hypothetical protein
MMYSRNGGIEVATVDAITNCHSFPGEWTLRPWIRPDNRPDIFIQNDWDTHFAGAALIDLARTTFPDNGAFAGIDTPEKAYTAISEYLANTVHPDAKPAPAPATPST